MSHTGSLQDKVVLITGAAHRVGAAMTRHFHAAGMRVVIHYRHSATAAQDLADELNNQRMGSATTVSGDLNDTSLLSSIIDQSAAVWGGLDILVNNASTFYPTDLGKVTVQQWDDLFASNLKAPFFLSQAAAPYLRKGHGVIINIVDIHADKPLKGYPVYCMAKAGLVMMTKALARELGGDIRVNAIAPGAILWPEGIDEAAKADIVSRTALKRKGDPEDIARAAMYLVRDAGYVTGQILAVDGGRSLSH
ncbi:MAG: pteridine reductase [Gammaproteobacteria bacterium]|nr:pteridine reductase [Gammaproteobacteria bacterium]